MDVVHHIELVLNEIRIWIDGLVLIARQLLVCEILGCYVVVITSLPRWLVTAGASPTHEELLTLLYLLIVQVAGTRNGKTTMPYHEGIEIFHALLWLEDVVLVVKLVGLWIQQVCHGFLDSLVGTISIIRRCCCLLYTSDAADD